jgi:hypothetical protein
MSAARAVTMEELELERAELLPSRETLYVVSHHQPTFNFAQVGYGNTAQSGFSMSPLPTAASTTS